MEKNLFDQWIKTNAELSVVKEEAEKLLQATAVSDLEQDMENCVRSVLTIKEDCTPHDQYHVRRAITKLAHAASVGKLTLVSLLESHNSVDSDNSPSRIIMKGCAQAIETESMMLNDFWKNINT